MESMTITSDGYQSNNSIVHVGQTSGKNGRVDESIKKTLNVQYTEGHPDLPVIVFVHGFGCDQSAWEDTITYLRQDIKYMNCGTLTYDLPFSGNVQTGYYSVDVYDSIEPYVEDIVFILKYHKISRCIFVCHSISGLIGLQACVRYKHLFSQLVLIGSAARYLNGDGYKFGISRKMNDDHLKLIETSYGEYIKEFSEISLRMSTNIIKKKLTIMMEKMDPKVVSSVIKMAFNTDLHTLLPQITVPCYVWQTIGNGLITTACARYMVNNMNLSTKRQLLHINARGQIPHLSNGDQVAARLCDVVIRDWIREYQPEASYLPHGILPESQRSEDIHEKTNKRKSKLTLLQENMELKQDNEFLRTQIQNIQQENIIQQESMVQQNAAGNLLGDGISRLVSENLGFPTFSDDDAFGVYDGPGYELL